VGENGEMPLPETQKRKNPLIAVPKEGKKSKKLQKEKSVTEKSGRKEVMCKRDQMTTQKGPNGGGQNRNRLTKEKRKKTQVDRGKKKKRLNINYP